MLKWLERRERDALRDGQAVAAILFAPKMPKMLADIISLQLPSVAVTQRLFSLLACSNVKELSLKEKEKSDMLYRQMSAMR